MKKAMPSWTALPPEALTLGRANGDRLFRDPAGNVFAVSTGERAPSTMFKPDNDPAYWEEVKAREVQQAVSSGRQPGDA